jgi:hypothetical protein
MTRILTMFQDGEDTAVVLSALSSTVAVVLHHIGASPDDFAEGVQQSLAKVAELMAARGP